MISLYCVASDYNYFRYSFFESWKSEGRKVRKVEGLKVEIEFAEVGKDTGRG